MSPKPSIHQLIRVCMRSLAPLLYCAYVLCSSTIVHAISLNDLQSLISGTPFYDSTDVACGGDPTVTPISNPTSPTTDSSVTYDPARPPGSTPEEEVYRWFVQIKGLSPIATAGIMGNIKAESHFNPADGQTDRAWTDMSSRNINEGGGGGVGIVQWDGGRRPLYINYAKSHGADPKDIVPQLNFIWDELHGSHKSTLTGGSLNGVNYPGIQNATDPRQAALTFHALYEVSADGPAKIQGRMDAAAEFLVQYTGAILADTAALKCLSTMPANVSPECANAAGTARIWCQATHYDLGSYFEGTKGGHQGAAKWHAECNKTYTDPVTGKDIAPAHVDKDAKQAVGPKCYLDCSGLVNLAVYDVYGVDLDENTDSERADSNVSGTVFGETIKGNGRYWKVVQLGDLQPGDLIQPFSGHVEIINYVQGKKIYTFGAHTDAVPQDRQINESQYTADGNDLYLRYVGPGATVNV